MKATIERHLKLYFSSKVGVFFSLLGALLAFVLYILFLQNNLVISWKDSMPKPEKILDLWIMGGVLTVTGITTSWAALSRIVSDKERHVWQDLILTDVSPLSITLGYILSASLISFIMQILVGLVMAFYFKQEDGLVLSTKLIPQLLQVALLSSLQGSLFATTVLQFVNKMSLESRISTLVGTASGFLVGVYMPIGVLPDSAQQLVKFVPGAYVASLFRHILLDAKVESFGQAGIHFSKFMGIGLEWDKLTTKVQDYQIVLAIIAGQLLILAIILMLKRKNKLTD